MHVDIGLHTQNLARLLANLPEVAEERKEASVTTTTYVTRVLCRGVSNEQRAIIALGYTSANTREKRLSDSRDTCKVQRGHIQTGQREALQTSAAKIRAKLQPVKAGPTHDAVAALPVQRGPLLAVAVATDDAVRTGRSSRHAYSREERRKLAELDSGSTGLSHVEDTSALSRGHRTHLYPLTAIPEPPGERERERVRMPAV